MHGANFHVINHRLVDSTKTPLSDWFEFKYDFLKKYTRNKKNGFDKQNYKATLLLDLS